MNITNLYTLDSLSCLSGKASNLFGASPFVIERTLNFYAQNNDEQSSVAEPFDSFLPEKKEKGE